MTRFLTTTFLVVIIIVLTFGQHLSEANKHVKKKKKRDPSVVDVVGKVYCDTCFQDDSDNTGHFISGASVAVECKHSASTNPTFRGEAKTDVHGEFRVRLPFSVTKHTKMIKGCSARLVKSGEPYCTVAATTSSSIRLRSRRHGTRVFSAGFFTFRPLNQPSLCRQKPTTGLESSLNIPDLSFPPPLKDPTEPGDLPPLPSLPIPNIHLPNLPDLPPLPPLPRLLPGNLPPIITGAQKAAKLNRAEKTDDQNDDAMEFFFPPNPFQSPPAPLILNPLLIRNPFQPPPAPFFPVPTIPGLTQSPPPPPPLAFPFPFPPFPFRPPRSPGTPPAS